MIKKLFLSFAVFFLLATQSTLHAAIGEWRLHNSYHNATYCQKVKDRIYVLSNGALYSYNYEDEEIRTYDKIDTLSDGEISFISYCSSVDALVIIYKNLNIDLLYSDETVYNISDFKNSNITNKIINNISIIDDIAYLSTNFGIVELDLKKKEFNKTYNINKEVLCCYNYNNYIYAGTTEGLYIGNTSDNLLDNKNWSKIEDYKVLNFEEFDGDLYYLVEKSGIYVIDNEKNKIAVEKQEENKTENSDNIIEYNGKITIKSDLLLSTNKANTPVYLYEKSNKLYAGTSSNLIIFDSKDNYKKYSLDGKSKFILADGNTLWNCKGYSGFVKSSLNDGKIVDEEEAINPNSPVRNYCEYMKFEGNKLLVAGGTLNYYDITFYDATLMTYDYENDYWTNFKEEGIKESTNTPYRNMSCIVEDPLEPGHYFASSFGHGLYEYRDGEFIKHYNHTNSDIESVLPNNQSAKNYVRVCRLQYDKDGNLWIINTQVKDIVKVLKRDGTWLSLKYDLISEKPTMVEMLFDSRGWLWISSLRAPGGLFCAKMNNTPLDTSDDETKMWNDHIKNQDGINYDINYLNDIKEDRNGIIWVATDAGLFIIENPKVFFEDGIFKQIKIPRNDGSGLADYLLNNVNIQVIHVDGANRKWIGTRNNGIYLLSEDGQETIHHFTMDNSPLPSNGIVSIAINDESGEVFIGTYNGIVSFMGNATKPETELDENKVHAFPNPVRADYSGDISIIGLTFNCDVKIVDAAGFLIYEGVSNGGEFVWDGRNSKGEKVASGVYYVLAADEEGNEGVATKILIVR